MISYEEIMLPVKDILRKVEQHLIKSVSSPVPILPEISLYLMKSGGKRIRPLICSLWSKVFRTPESDAVKLSTIIELIHTATLMHDDVVDFAEMRRGMPSANVIWGNKISVLGGDHMISQATLIGLKMKNKIVNVLLDVITKMIEGEAIQLTNTDIENFDSRKYMDIITRKTALLMSSACGLPGVCVNANKKLIKSAFNYGLNFGIAFQIVDDALDYDSSEDISGKKTGKDLQEVKITLPLILSYQKAGKREKRKILNFIKRTKMGKTDQDELEEMIELIKELGGPFEAREIARNYSEAAKKELNLFKGPEEILTSLEKLCEFILSRKE